MILGVPKETFPGEQRVALVPGELPRLIKAGHVVRIEGGAGDAAGYPDAHYSEKGATIVPRGEALAAEVVVQVRGFGSTSPADLADLSRYQKKATVVAFLDPLGDPSAAARLAETGVQALAMELVPRITRAQSMDALSSQANLAGYKSVLIAAAALPRILPMMMTAAGTISPARVFVVGAGVAGLQAIATAKRLGAVVEAYDIRPEVADQVRSVGGKFIQLELDTDAAGDQGGYAKAQSETFYVRQRELMAAHVRSADVTITTAAVPGRRAPTLVTEAMLQGSKPGSVLVDLAAETGGNCEVTRAGETVHYAGVTVIGPTNVPSSIAHHASQLYARNVSALVSHITDPNGALHLDASDAIVAGCLVCQHGAIVHQRVQEALKALAGENR